jgi:hypothetical protein
MSALPVLFALRVLGQALVVFLDVAWLPAVEHWESGLLPYPALLAAQSVILVVLVTVDRQVWQGAGWFVEPRPRVGVWLRRFSYLYAGSMIARYAVSMALVPEWRWFGRAIPIVFHCLLALWLFAYARVLAGAGSSNVSRSSGRRRKIRHSDWYAA